MSNPQKPRLSPDDVKYWDRVEDNLDLALETMRKLPPRRWDGTKLVPVEPLPASPASKDAPTV